MDISVIIPVYNTPLENLKRCLESVRIPEGICYEVILVDDGSASETADFCRMYAEKSAVFRYVRQENRGVSSARNTGISHAAGRYVIFVDSDDELLPQILKREYLDGDWDIVFFDFEMQREGLRRVCRLFAPQTGQCPDKKAFLDAACRNRVNSVWAKLFRRAFLLEYSAGFDESMVVAEDAKFMFSLILRGKRLLYVDAIAYRYNSSDAHGSSRLERHSRKILENTVSYYDMKIAALDAYGGELGLCAGETRKFEAVVSGQVIRDLFEAVGSLLLLDIVCQEMDPVIRERTGKILEEYGTQLPLKTRIKGALLRHDWKRMIRACAWLRLIYIKIHI